MKFVVSDQKAGKAYSASTEQDLFVGKKIGEIVKLDEMGLAGYEAKITGGSDKQGFPMSKSLVGAVRKKIFTSDAMGFNATRKGERKRVTVRGNSVSGDTAQLNLVVTKAGAVELEKVLAKKGATPEDTLSAKERMIKKSLELAGSAELGSGVKKPKH